MPFELMTLRQRTPFRIGSGLSAVAPASLAKAARKSARLMSASALRVIGGSLGTAFESGGPGRSRSRSVTPVVQVPAPHVPGMGDVATLIDDSAAHRRVSHFVRRATEM